jgi:hypothetical protein
MKYKISYSNDNIIYTFWFGDPMSDNRRKALQSIIDNSQCKVKLITENNINEYILPNEPLHPGFQYLSHVHKADYLRCYFMHFYGGGYNDIKQLNTSWKYYFNKLNNDPNLWIIGYKEVGPGGAAILPGELGKKLKDNWQKLIGNGCYICKPNTPFTQKWYQILLKEMDNNLDKLKLSPASNPRDHSGMSNYPLKWTQILGDIFHPLCLEFSDNIDNSLPTIITKNYMGGSNDRYNHWENEFKLWEQNKDRESSSGVGSTTYNTKNTKSTLLNVINKYNIKSILDIPCGDMNWISKIDLNSQYTGMDISNSLIEYNKKNYSFMGDFHVHDIVTTSLNKNYDLILSRDFLFHLNHENTLNVIHNFKNSGSTYLLTSTFPESKYNDKINDNGFFRINLQLEPFNLPEPIELFPEIETGKHLGLWKLKEIL